MAPLVIIRSGSSHIEYRTTCIKGRYHPQKRLNIRNSDGDYHSANSDNEESASDDADEGARFHVEDDSEDEEDEQEEKMGIYSNALRDLPGLHAFRCSDCGNVVADRDDLVSKTFFGRTGKSFLMNNMFNVTTGHPRNRYLLTGMHTIADVCCSICDLVLGWKYIKAMESTQKYKEGKYIMEQALVQDESEEKAWKRL